MLITANRSEPIVLGKQGESLVNTVKFNVSALIEELGGGGIFTLLHQRRCDSAGYPCEITEVDDGVLWEIHEADVLYDGRGYAQLVYSLGDGRSKSEIYETETLKALSQSSAAPEAWSAWVHEVIEAAQLVLDAETHPPVLDPVSLNWMLWSDGHYVDTGVCARGEDGVSPEASVQRVEGGAMITITDARGTTQAEVHDGQGGGGAVSWEDVTGKPEQYPPTEHSHSGYAAADHTHDGSYAALGHDHDGVYQPAGQYADADHTHTVADITDLVQCIYPVSCSEVGGVKSFDKTYAQISAALAAGQIPVVSYDGRKYLYANNNYSCLWFYSVEINQNKVYSIRIDSSNAVTTGMLETVAKGHAHVMTDVSGLSAALAEKLDADNVTHETWTATIDGVETSIEVCVWTGAV